MFFTPDNIWLWVSAALASAVLAIDILSALLSGFAAKAVSVIAFPLHILLVAALLLGGAELVLAVTCMTVSLLVYTAAHSLKLYLGERREEEDDL